MKCKIALVLILVLWMTTLVVGSVDARPNINQDPAHAAQQTAIPVSTLLNQRLLSLLSGSLVATDTETSDDGNTDPIPNFGSHSLTIFMAMLDLAYDQGRAFVSNFSALPQLSNWFDQQHNDPKLNARWTSIGNDIMHIVVPIFIGVMILEFFLLPVRKTLRLRQPSNVSGRVTIILSLFLLRALPILVFVSACVALIDHGEAQKLPRFIILNFVYAISLSRILLALFRGILAPNSDALRLFPVTRHQAQYGYRWLCIFTPLIVYGYFCIDVARAVHMPDGPVVAFENVLGLVLATFAITLILRIRRSVGLFLRGAAVAPRGEQSWFVSLRHWLGHVWHILAIIYIVLGYIITDRDTSTGLSLLLRGTILTLIIFVATHFFLRVIANWGNNNSRGGLSLHRDVMRFLFSALVWVLAIVGIAVAWGADIKTVLESPLGQRFLASSISIFATLVVLTVVYEGLSFLIEHQLNKVMVDEFSPYTNARQRTLLPMLRNIAFFFFAIVAVLVVLNESGVNIGPLLAGAGVVGVAIGFGSQTLVKDFLTGLFIVVENTIAIGDVVKIGDHTGVVEAMSIRTLRLRDNDGNMHIMPFSDVTSIVNMTRDYSYAVIKVGVSYDSDLNKATNLMKAVCEEMQRDPALQPYILEPIEIQGVDNLGDYSVTLAARLKTRPGKQWDIRRVFLYKMKMRFDREGIEMPYPTVYQVQKAPKGT